MTAARPMPPLSAVWMAHCWSSISWCMVSSGLESGLPSAKAALASRMPLSIMPMNSDSNCCAAARMPASSEPMRCSDLMSL